MKFREFFDEARYSLWEAQDTLRHRVRQTAQRRRGRARSDEPSALSTLIGDLTRPQTSWRDKFRIRKAAMPHRRAWKKYKRNQQTRERMWGPQSRMPTQPFDRPKR